MISYHPFEQNCEIPPKTWEWLRKTLIEVSWKLRCLLTTIWYILQSLKHFGSNLYQKFYRQLYNKGRDTITTWRYCTLFWFLVYIFVLLRIIDKIIPCSYKDIPIASSFRFCCARVYMAYGIPLSLFSLFLKLFNIKLESMAAKTTHTNTYILLNVKFIEYALVNSNKMTKGKVLHTLNR